MLLGKRSQQSCHNSSAGHRRFAIGVDYGTNSVRAIVVDLADGSETASCVYDYPSGEAGILLDPKDPHLARQNPADYIEGFYQRGGRGRPGGQTAARLSARARRRHRRRHDRLDADPRRSPRHAAGPASRVPRQSGGPCLAVEGPHELRRGGRNHREGPAHAATAIWPSAAASIAANGSGRRFCTAGGPRRRSSRRPTPGWNWPISCRPISPAISIPTRSPAASARPATRRCTTSSGAACRASSFCGNSIPRWPAVAERFAKPALTADHRAGGLTEEIARQGRPAAGRGRGRRRLRRPHGRRRRGHQAGNAGEDHRHQHLRHDGRADGQVAARHPRPVRHRARLDHSRHVRPGGGPIGRGRHLQLVRQVSHAGGLHGQGRSARQSYPRGRKAPARRKRTAGPRLEQRQPHDPGRSAADAACWSGKRCTRPRRKSIGRWSRRRPSAP